LLNKIFSAIVILRLPLPPDFEIHTEVNIVGLSITKINVSKVHFLGVPLSISQLCSKDHFKIVVSVLYLEAFEETAGMLYLGMSGSYSKNRIEKKWGGRVVTTG
jgi:hypothetical protein